MPFWDTPLMPGILSGVQQGGKKVFNDWHPGHAPVVNHNGLGDIFTGLAAQAAKTLGPFFPNNTIPGQGTMAPDSPPIRGGKAWEQDPQGTPPSIFDQLIELALGGGQGDPNQYSSAAHAAVNAEYDPQIANLRRLMGLTENRANANSGKIGAMYSALSGADKADIPVIDQMFNQGNKQITSQYDKMQGQTDQAYQQAQKEQMDLMSRLNLTAAAPDALKQQQTNQAFQTGQNQESQQSMHDAMKLLQTGADNFSNQGASIARFEGTNRQADLMSQLQDFLTQSEGKIGDLNTAKSQAYQAALGQAQNTGYQRQQDLFTRLLDVAKLQQSGQANPTTYHQGPLAASQYLGQNSTDPATLNSFLLQVLQGDPFTSGQTPGPNGTQNRLTPEAAAKLAQEQAAQAGMSPENQQAIYLATLAYYGRMQ